MVTSKISWMFFICQVGYMLQVVTAEENCTMQPFDNDGMISITPPDAYYQQGSERIYCWMIELPQNSNDFIRIRIAHLLLSTSMGPCFDTFSITEFCGNMSTMVLKGMCFCSGNCMSPSTRNVSRGCYFEARLTKANEGIKQRLQFTVNFSLDTDSSVPSAPFSTTNAAISSKSSSHDTDSSVPNAPFSTTNAATSSKSSSHDTDSSVPNAPFSTTNAATSSKSFSHDTNSLVPNTPSSTTYTATVSKSFSHDTNSLVSNTPSSTRNAANFSKSLKGKQTGPGAKVLVPVLVILIMILVVALSVAYFIRYYRRRKSGDKVASNTTFNNAAYSQNDVITSESHVESQLSDRNVRTETVNETPEISHSEQLHGDNVEYNPIYVAGNEPNKEGQVDNVAYQSVDDANQNPHEYTYIDLEGKQEERKNANQGQTSHVANVTDGNDSSNPVKPPDESKYYYIEPRIH
ncbi:uncharacterized protein [Apostichopus japonicus]|uniref:uncharacterized protein isoform X2 n=1 Tax=Stichopus japonicus TaxID=307972 RepID=UPI003AB8983B